MHYELSILEYIAHEPGMRFCEDSINGFGRDRGLESYSCLRPSTLHDAVTRV